MNIEKRTDPGDGGFWAWAWIDGEPAVRQHGWTAAEAERKRDDDLARVLKSSGRVASVKQMRNGKWVEIPLAALD